jgi:hypothetical protein
MFVAAIVLALLILLTGDSPSLRVAGDLVLFAPFLAFPIVGALIASKRPGNAIGWICLAAGLLWMSILMGEAQDAYEAATTGTVTFSAKLEALFQWSWVPPVGLLGVYMILLFPDGRLPSRRWRPFAWFAGSLMAVICVGFVFIPGPLVDRPKVLNPFGVDALAWLADVAVFVVLLLPVCILVSAASLVVRYRRSGSEVRQQIKWLAFAAGFVGVNYSGGLLAQIFFVPETLETGNASGPWWVELLNNLLLMSYAGIPVAVGIAILRYRLYDIEIIINRALVYGSLTVILAAVYFGGVAVVQAVFRALTGQQEPSQLAVVASTLAIAALFDPLRRRVQELIDRRFYRKKYDAGRVLAGFSARLRDHTDLDKLDEDLLATMIGRVWAN